MTTKKKGKNAPKGVLRGQSHLPAAEPEDVSMVKARKLPMFGPGIVIVVPLNLLPAYLETYHLEPRGMSANGTLLVKRVAPIKKDPSDVH